MNTRAFLVFPTVFSFSLLFLSSAILPPEIPLHSPGYLPFVAHSSFSIFFLLPSFLPHVTSLSLFSSPLLSSFSPSLLSSFSHLCSLLPHPALSSSKAYVLTNIHAPADISLPYTPTYEMKIIWLNLCMSNYVSPLLGVCTALY